MKLAKQDIQILKLLQSDATTSTAIRELHSHMAVTEIKNVTELPLDTQL
jgi:Lrp/AsnC family transcriptional regulator